MEKVISFIIPSFNAGKYLDKGLASFVHDGLMEKMEVLVIDDGSQDDTAAIARKYVGRYPQTYSLASKENGGHGSAINMGMGLAKGKYVKAVDADDWVITENLPVYIEALEGCQSDVVLTPYHMVEMASGKRTPRRMFCKEYGRDYPLGEVLAQWKDFDRCLTFHGIAYNREFYREHGCKLSEGIFYEDHEYAAIPCCHARTIFPLDLDLYQYMVGNSQQSVSEANQLKRIGHMERVASRLASYGQRKKGLSPDGREYVLRKAEDVALSVYMVACLSNPQKRRGRRECRRFNRRLRGLNPVLCQRLQTKCRIFMALSCLGISRKTYGKLIQSNLYNKLRHNHPIGEIR